MTQHITQNSIVRCPECEENFCEKCKIHHEVAKATKKHEIVSIENVLKLPKFVQDIKMSCSEHDERFVLYCDYHGVTCCTHCLQNIHVGCRNLIPIHKLIQNVKESSLLVDLETTLSDLLTNITNIIEDRTANLQDLEEQKNKCKKEITTSRDAINAYFDELETDLMVNLQDTFVKREVEIQKTLEDFKLRLSNVCEMQENVSIVKNIASEFQSFMAIRELSQLANTFVTDLQHLFESGSFSWTEILSTQTDLQSVQDIIKSFGKIDINQNPSKLVFKVRKTREAQLIGPSQFPRNIEGIQLKVLVKNKLPDKKNKVEILDCSNLPNDNMIFLDRKNNCLVILDSNGVFVRTLNLSFCPSHFVVINKDTIAISTEDSVKIVDLKRGDVVKTLIPGTKVRSIALTDDKHLMVEITGTGYTMIDFQGNIKKRIHIDLSDSYFHPPVCIKERLYYVDIPNAILNCYDFEGNRVSKFEDKRFKSHTALTSDQSNTLFCSSWTDTNVFVISTDMTDRKSIKEIIKSDVHLNQAVSAHYNINKKELLIVTIKGNFILYDVI